MREHEALADLLLAIDTPLAAQEVKKSYMIWMMDPKLIEWVFTTEFEKFHKGNSRTEEFACIFGHYGEGFSLVFGGLFAASDETYVRQPVNLIIDNPAQRKFTNPTRGFATRVKGSLTDGQYSIEWAERNGDTDYRRVLLRRDPLGHARRDSHQGAGLGPAARGNPGLSAPAARTLPRQGSAPAAP